MNKIISIGFKIFLGLVVVGIIFLMLGSSSLFMKSKKPVIYLYPEEEMEVSVKLDFDGYLTCTYPKYDDGWDVIAKPSGELFNLGDNREYASLFWEGDTAYKFTLDEGFVVKGEDTMVFLQEKLDLIGLTTKEANEFIMFWLPLMEHNEYNLIHFSTDEYEEVAKLEIEPEPDSMLRVFMVYKAMDEYVEIPEQLIEPFIREGFTVVEWGGLEME